MSIAGSPEGVEAAATTLDDAGRAFTDAADAIASHGRSVTADWVGTASDAAGGAIAGLSVRTRVGAEVSTEAGAVLRAYAAELRAAQRAWEAARAMGDAEPGQADAAARAQRANEAAAARIDALTDQLTGMAGARSASGTATTDQPRAEHDHGWLYDAVGGFGDGLWRIGPGAVGEPRRSGAH